MTTLAPTERTPATSAATDTQADASSRWKDKPQRWGTGPARSTDSLTISTRRALATLALTLALTACGTSDATPAADPSPSIRSTVVARPTAPVDDVFTIGSGRLHLHCEGEGPATVLLIAGWDTGGDAAWAAVRPTLSQDTRVCTYDRFGTGTSDPPASVQTFRSQAADLDQLLEVAGEPGPYVLVGHSFGGAEAVTFAVDHQEQVAGLALVDASPTSWPGAVCAVPDDGTQAARDLRELCAVMRDPARDAERLDVALAFEEVAAITSLGDLPMTVLTAAHRTAPGLAPRELARLDAAWSAGTARWARLSTAATVVSVDDTSHYIQNDHPQLIVDEVTELLPRDQLATA